MSKMEECMIRVSCKVFLVLFTLGASVSNASLILTVERTGFESQYHYNGFNMQTLTGYIDQSATVDFGSFDDLPNMLAYDAIWIPFANRDRTLTPLEFTNLSAFIATGRRVFLHGENYLWKTWNDSMLSLVGGETSATELSRGPAEALLENELTKDARLIHLAGGGKVSSGAGVPLYTQGSIHLWGDNVVSVFDVNLFDNYYSPQQSNDQFIHNLADWLSADFSPVPVPTTLTLFLLALPGLLWSRAGSRRPAT